MLSQCFVIAGTVETQSAIQPLVRIASAPVSCAVIVLQTRSGQTAFDRNAYKMAVVKVQLKLHRRKRTILFQKPVAKSRFNSTGGFVSSSLTPSIPAFLSYLYLRYFSLPYYFPIAFVCPCYILRYRRIAVKNISCATHYVMPQIALS